MNSTTKKKADPEKQLDAGRPCLIFHGHFYQPPRENPWTGVVERECEAQPFHDWNSRITAECYEANAWARIVDDKGKIVNIVNNYSKISFNVGPTLMSWLAQWAPKLVYNRIVQAERQNHGASLERQKLVRRGAIAQAYNHTILPLASERDKRTQIRWGIRDFKRHFGRFPAGMWLPETAINQETVNVLAQEGLRFTVLSPWQVERIRPVDTQEWRDVRNGTVDSTMPYRVYATDGSDRYLDVFFYDGQLSHGMGFGNILKASFDLLNAAQSALGRSWRARKAPPAVNVAVDGETFGHHKAFGDRALAYALNVEAAQRGFQVTTYEEYLQAFPPTWEARLKPGPDGEGTAWSCAHGVGRWVRDCGCNTGGEANWNQAWRTPLRKALDLVQVAADSFFEEAGGEIFNDVWAARDECVDLLDTRDPLESRRRFMARNARTYLDPEQETKALKILDMARMTQYMYTSCGWFFSDISGRESQQVLRYAAKTIDSLQQLGAPSPQADFLEMLAEARSNIPKQGSGADVYRNHVMPLKTSPHRLVAQLAISGLVNVTPSTANSSLYKVERLHNKTQDSGFLSLSMGRYLCTHSFTGERFDLAAAVLHLGGQHVHSAVGPIEGEVHYHRLSDDILERLPHGYASNILRAIEEALGDSFFTLDALASEDRDLVLRVLFKPALDRIRNGFSYLYEDTRELMRSLEDAGMVPPTEFKMVAEFTLGNRLEKEILAHQGSWNPAAYRKAIEIASQGTKRGLRLQKANVEEYFSKNLLTLSTQLQKTPTLENARHLLDMLQLIERLELKVPLEQPQEELFDLLSNPNYPARQDADLGETLDQIAKRLWVLPAGERKR